MIIKIQKNTGLHNTTMLPNRKIEWIVIHYTAGNTSKKGSAYNTCAWFKNPAAGGSADFAVDDEEIYQYNPDIKNRYCWAVGGSYPNKTVSISKQYYGVCTNRNSISIELCSNKLGNTYSFSEKVLALGAELTRYLMAIYHIGVDHVVMHAQCSGKPCPLMWTAHESDLQYWREWRKRLVGNGGKVGENVSAKPFTVKINKEGLWVWSKPSKKSDKVVQLKKDGIYTIVKKKGKFGLLKSYQGKENGWIDLNYCTKV